MSGLALWGFFRVGGVKDWEGRLLDFEKEVRDACVNHREARTGLLHGEWEVKMAALRPVLIS